MKRFLKYIFIVAQFNCAIAQDTHYWSQQYGTRSALLGGAVIGGVNDNSAIYYNPAALSKIENKNLSVSANAYQLNSIIMRDGAGKGVKLESSTIETMPLIISGLYRPKKYTKHTIGYCLLTKDQFSIRTDARVDDFRNIYDNNLVPGNENYIAQFNLHYILYDMISGWGYSYKLSDKFSIGLGNYGSYRHFTTDWNHIVRVIPVDSLGIFSQNSSSFNESYNINIRTVSTFFKLALNYVTEHWKFGLTATSPNIKVWGQGSILADLSAKNVDVFNIGFKFNFTANDNQKNLETRYKTPLSVAVGGEYNTNKTTIAFSAEWFDKVDKYNVMKPEKKDFIRPAGSLAMTSDEFLLVSESKKSVINYAFGVQQKLTEKLIGSLGFRTNYSYASNDQVSEKSITFTTWDLYHGTVGLTKKREKSDLSVVCNLTYGEQKQMSQWVNLTEPQTTNFLSGKIGKTNTLFTSIAFIVGYTIYIK